MPAGNVNKNWTVACCTPDGLTIYVCGGYIYKSVDGGANWTCVYAVSKSWADICCDDSGQYVFATTNMGTTRSANGGASWINNFDVYNTLHRCCMGSDGQWRWWAYPGIYGELWGRLKYTTNGGVSWANYSGIGDWADVKCDSTGQNMICSCIKTYGAGYPAKGLYIRRSSGTFTLITPVGISGATWAPLACSRDFSTLLIQNGGTYKLYLSHDSGVTWAETVPDPTRTKPWKTLAVNGVGSVLLAGSSQRLYSSGL
jgi:hypothetical protein